MAVDVPAVDVDLVIRDKCDYLMHVVLVDGFEE